MKLSRAALVVMASVGGPAAAVADGMTEPSRVRARKVIVRPFVERPVVVAKYLPPCDPGIELLLGCVERIPVRVTRDDVGVLNSIAAIRIDRARPYRQLYSWD